MDKIFIGMFTISVILGLFLPSNKKNSIFEYEEKCYNITLSEEKTNACLVVGKYYLQTMDGKIDFIKALEGGRDFFYLYPEGLKKMEKACDEGDSGVCITLGLVKKVLISKDSWIADEMLSSANYYKTSCNQGNIIGCYKFLFSIPYFLPILLFSLLFIGYPTLWFSRGNNGKRYFLGFIPLNFLIFPLLGSALILLFLWFLALPNILFFDKVITNEFFWLGILLIIIGSTIANGYFNLSVVDSNDSDNEDRWFKVDPNAHNFENP